MAAFGGSCTVPSLLLWCENNEHVALKQQPRVMDNSLLNMPIGMSIGWDIAYRYLLTPSIGMRICRSIRVPILLGPIGPEKLVQCALVLDRCESIYRYLFLRPIGSDKSAQWANVLTIGMSHCGSIPMTVTNRYT